VNESSINSRREEQNYEWIVPVDYMSNLEDFSDSFILNRSQSKIKLKNVLTVMKLHLKHHKF